jgi:hypothetical protein
MRGTKRERMLLSISSLLFIGGVLFFQADPVNAQKYKRPPTGPLVTIYAPSPKSFELALDEVELDWSGKPDTKKTAPAAAAIEVDGAKLAERGEQRAAFAVAGKKSLKDLSDVTKALKVANPETEAYLVLYEPGFPRSKATRQLLTREVGLLVEEEEDVQGVLAKITAGSVRPVPGVPGGYVVEAEDPGAALDLAEALRQQPGVRTAYPLLRRQQSLR